MFQSLIEKFKAAWKIRFSRGVDSDYAWVRMTWNDAPEIDFTERNKQWVATVTESSLPDETKRQLLNDGDKS